MKKAITFKEFKAVQRMPLNTFNRWVSSIYMSGVQDGLKEGEKELDECYTFTTDELTTFLQTIPGIGQKTAEKIVDAIINEGENCENRG